MNDHSLSQFGNHELESQLAPGRVDSPAAQSELTPLPDGRYLLRVDLDLETWENLRYAQALLGDEVPAGDMAAVIERALQAFVDDAEKGGSAP
jgi:hypothetical protein